MVSLLFYLRLLFLKLIRDETCNKQNYCDRRNFCKFCEKDTSHFARHMITWHNSELEVQRFCNLRINRKKKGQHQEHYEKKRIFLRNKTTNEKLRLVNRLQNSTVMISLKDDFLPCQYCKKEVYIGIQKSVLKCKKIFNLEIGKPHKVTDKHS